MHEADSVVSWDSAKDGIIFRTKQHSAYYYRYGASYRFSRLPESLPYMHLRDVKFATSTGRSKPLPQHARHYLKKRFDITTMAEAYTWRRNNRWMRPESLPAITKSGQVPWSTFIGLLDDLAISDKQGAKDFRNVVESMDLMSAIRIDIGSIMFRPRDREVLRTYGELPMKYKLKLKGFVTAAIQDVMSECIIKAKKEFQLEEARIATERAQSFEIQAEELRRKAEALRVEAHVEEAIDSSHVIPLGDNEMVPHSGDRGVLVPGYNSLEGVEQ